MIEPHLRLDTSSFALNKSRIFIASVTSPIFSAAPATIPKTIPMQSVDSRIPIYSEHAGPSRYASTPTGLHGLRLPRARLKPKKRFERARQHSLARRGGRARELDIPASPPGTTAPEPSASNIAFEAGVNSTTATTSKPVDGASSTPTSRAAEKQREPVSGGLAIPAGSPQFLTPQPNKPVSLAPSAPWLTLTSQTGASGTTTHPVPLLNLIVVAKSTGSDTCDTTPPHTTSSAQPSSALLKCAASPWPTPVANPTGSAQMTRTTQLRQVRNR